MKGASHHLPDYLSRKPSSCSSKEDIVFCRAINTGTPNASEHGGSPDKPFEHLIKLAKEDQNYGMILEKVKNRQIPSKNDNTEIRSFLPIWNDLSISGNLLLLGDKIVIPEKARNWLLKALHSGHQGTSRTLALGRVRYFWPSLSKDIRQMCQSCKDCIKYLPSQAKEPLIMTSA